jgi:hypothetical protein
LAKHTANALKSTINRRERAKKYLEQYCPTFCRSIQSKLMLDQLESQRDSWTQRYDTCGGGSGNKKDIGDIVARFDALVSDAKRRTAALEFFLEEIDSVVANVQAENPNAAVALTKRYLVVGKAPEWMDIADDLGYAEATVKLHHARGLDLVADILEENDYDSKLYTFLYAKP